MAPVTAQDAVRLRAEIESELVKLARTLGEIEFRRPATDDTATYALALLLMNYYTGAEHIFERIARQFGGLPPPSERWHAQLLEDMGLDLKQIRPAVLEGETAESLLGLLKFRHAIRHMYAWTVRRDEMDRAPRAAFRHARAAGARPAPLHLLPGRPRFRLTAGVWERVGRAHSSALGDIVFQGLDAVEFGEGGQVYVVLAPLTPAPGVQDALKVDFVEVEVGYRCPVGQSCGGGD